MSLWQYRLRPRRYRPRTILAAPIGYLDHITRLSRDWLWLGGWMNVGVGDRVRCRLETSAGTIEQDCAALSFRRRDVEWNAGARGLVVLVAAGPLDEVREVWIELAQGWFRWSGRRAPTLSSQLDSKQDNELRAMADSAEELRARLSRFGLVEKLTATPANDEIFATNRPRLGFLVTAGAAERRRRRAPEAPRPHDELEPPFSTSLDATFSYGIDQCLAIDDRHVFLRGWIWDPTESLTDLSLICDSCRVDGVADQLGSQARPDVVDHVRGSFPSLCHLARGFTGLVEMPCSAPEGIGHLELRSADGSTLAVRPPISPADAVTRRHEVVRSVAVPPELDAAFLGRHLRPALALLAEQIPRPSARYDEVFGVPLPSPAATLVFVCRDEVQWLEERLILTLRGRSCSEAEVILLAAEPSQAESLVRAAGAVESLVGLPIRVVIPDRSLGYAEAANFGCRSARSDRLVLLSDDVFAVEDEWLRPMLELMASGSAVAVGALLTSEDGAIRDLGLDLEAGREADTLLRPRARRRGWPPELAGAYENVEVPAKSGVALLTTRESFEAVSGFDESYLHRDAAGLDFCRRLAELGRGPVWHCGEARLQQVTRHEAVPVSDGWQPNPKTRFNDRWLLTRRWKPLVSAPRDLVKSREKHSAPRPFERSEPGSGLRIVHVIGGYLPEATAGTQLQLRELCREQIARGHRPSIFTRVERPEAEHLSSTADEWEGVPVTRLNNTFADCDSFERIYSHPKIDASFRSHLETERPDVVHVHHLSCLSTSMVDVAADLGLPVVMWLSDFWLVCLRGQRFHPVEGTVCLDLNRGRCIDCLSGLFPGLTEPDGATWEARLRGRDAGIEKLRAWDRHVRRILGRCDTLIVPSESQRQRFLEIGVDPHRCRVVEYGLPTRDLRRPPRGDAPIRSIGYLGSVIPSKGVHVLVEAFRRLDDESLRLDIHGEIVPFHEKSDYLSDLEALAGGDERIRFHGRYEAAELSGILAGIDLLVVPSLWWESYCLTAREGALAGLPVVTFPFAGLGEAVESGLAIGATPVDAQGLASTLRKVIDDPDLRDRASRQGEQVRDSVDAAADVEAIYRELVGVQVLRAVQ